MGRPARFAPLLAAVALIATSIARADRFTAPADVGAEADGSFSYECVFVKEDEPAYLEWMGWGGMENVTGGAMGDCFCICLLQPGDRRVLTIQGQLTNPQLPGRVSQHVSLCSAGGYQLTTDIHPFPAASVPGPGAPDARFWNEPNPFSTRTVFHYHMAEAGPVSLSIYDLSGRLVARVVNDVRPAGPHEVTWDPRTVPEGRLGGGVLFARLVAGGVVRMRTLILAR